MFELLVVLEHEFTESSEPVVSTSNIYHLSYYQLSLILTILAISHEVEVAEGTGSSSEAHNLEAACERVVTTAAGTSPYKTRQGLFIMNR